MSEVRAWPGWSSPSEERARDSEQTRGCGGVWRAETTVLLLDPMQACCAHVTVFIADTIILPVFVTSSSNVCEVQSVLYLRTR